MAEKKIVTLRDFFYVFFKSIKLILFVFITAVVGSVLYCLFASPIYQAETNILVKMGKESISALQDLSEPKYNVLFQERTQNINNEIAIIKGEFLASIVAPKLKEKFKSIHYVRSALTTVLDTIRDILYTPFYFLGLAHRISPDERQGLTFRKALDVEYLEETDLLKLTFDWDEPEFASFAVNTYAEEYVSQHINVYDKKQSYGFYIDQIKLYERKLNDIEDELEEFRKAGGISNISLQKDLLLRDITDLEIKYNNALIKYEGARVKYQKVKEMYATPGVWLETPDIGTDVTDKQAYLRNLDASYFHFKIQRNRLLRDYKSASREVKGVDRQLHALREQKAQSLLNILTLEMRTSASEKAILEQELSNKRKRLSDINALTLRLEQLERTRTIVETNYLLYKKKAEELRISDDLDKRKITSVKIINPGTPPLKPIHPRKGLIIGMAAFLGLFISFGLSFIVEFFNHTFTDDREVSAFLDLPLLMVIRNMTPDKKVKVKKKKTPGKGFFGLGRKGGSHGIDARKLSLTLALVFIVMAVFFTGNGTMEAFKRLSFARSTENDNKKPYIEKEVRNATAEVDPNLSTSQKISTTPVKIASSTDQPVISPNPPSDVPHEVEPSPSTPQNNSEIPAKIFGPSDQTAVSRNPSDVPGEILSLPYSLHLTAYDTLVKAKRAVSLYTNIGLSAFWVKIDLGSKGIWYRVFASNLEDAKLAEIFKKEHKLAESSIVRLDNAKKDFYSLHLASYINLERAERAVSVYRNNGLSAFRVKIDLGVKGIWQRVCVGKFETPKQAMGFRKEHGLQTSRIIRFDNDKWI